MRENFRLTEAGRNQAKWTIFRKLLCGFLIGESLLFTATLWIWKVSVGGIVTLAVVAIAMTAVFVKHTWNNEDISFHDWGLRWTNNQFISPKGQKGLKSNAAT